jgi:hypothetical protein
VPYKEALATIDAFKTALAQRFGQGAAEGTTDEV